jgi:mediator of RNA polymerase II transcription subunit 16
MESINQGRVIFLAHSDGSVEYRDRASMEETFNDGNLDEVWHLSQIGFTYPEDEPCRIQTSEPPCYANALQASRWLCHRVTAPLWQSRMTAR